MRTCPFCTKQISDEHFACRAHWFALTWPERTKIEQAYDAYKKGEIDIGMLRSIQSEIIDGVRARTPMKAEPKPGNCRSCNAAILWVRSAVSRQLMPLDALAVPNGNIILKDGEGLYLKKGETTTQPRFVSHFATCPDAKAHRKKDGAS